MRYFLGVQSNAEFDRQTYRFHNNILFSYHYFSNINAVKDMLQQHPDHNIIVDSGAFTSWTMGTEVDIDKLKDFYIAVHKIKPEAYFINLDKIPGSKGRKPTKEQAEEACKISWQNYQYLKQYVDNLLPVFHEDDNFDYLYKMMKETDYIAISPANDSSTKKRMVWLDQVYSILKADYKTHGLAATGESIMMRYPFYSVDSVSYRSFAMYGRGLYYSDNMLKVKRKNASSGSDYMMACIQREIEAYRAVESKMTRLWESRGITWDK